MEIGAPIILIILALAVVASETKFGSKVAEWGLKNLCGIDLDEVED